MGEGWWREQPGAGLGWPAAFPDQRAGAWTAPSFQPLCDPLEAVSWHAVTQRVPSSCCFGAGDSYCGCPSHGTARLCHNSVQGEFSQPTLQNGFNCCPFFGPPWK